MIRDGTCVAILICAACLLAFGQAAMADGALGSPCIVPESHETIQEALDDAALGNCEENLVTVLPGVYHESIRWPDVDGITLTGSSEGEAIIEPSIVEGSIITFAPGNVGVITERTMVRELTLQNGLYDAGGAVSCISANPKIARCRITECAAVTGGAIYCETASPLIDGCVIESNYAYQSGGGIYDTGGGARIANCLIRNNVAEELEGGGIFVYATLTGIRDCTITGNSALQGGGISALGASLTIEGCQITDNTAGSGGGIFMNDVTPVITNNVIARNDGGQTGGGIFF